jgi:GTP-binding protein
MNFTVAIVGRPNVGKSTLFNRLVGRRLALVDNAPGVTRDRREGRAQLGDLRFTIIDTAGLEQAAPETLSGRMRAQTEAAIASADAVLFMIDARAGVTPSDRAFADVVRKTGKPTIVVANKSEGRAGTAGAYESFALGLGDPVPVSAEHGEGLSDLYDALRAALPEQTDAPAEDEGESDAERPARPIRVAVIGRPNVGKSTLINHLLGEDRLLTGPEAGITRDAIAVPLAWEGRDFLVHDTAGMRRRARIDDKLEKLSVADALEAIRFADVVVMMMDAQAAFEEQDMRLADLVEREGRALVLGMNKWDLNDAGSGAIGKLRGEADHWLPQVKGVPVIALSGLTGFGLDRLMQAILDAHAVWNKRVPTNALNRWFEHAIDNNPPPAVSGRRLKLNYITQHKTRPPSFVLFCSRADAVPDSYLRYLTNGMRETFDLVGTPIRITLREKKNPYAGRKS